MTAEGAAEKVANNAILMAVARVSMALFFPALILVGWVGATTLENQRVTTDALMARVTAVERANAVLEERVTQNRQAMDMAQVATAQRLDRLEGTLVLRMDRLDRSVQNLSSQVSGIASRIPPLTGERGPIAGLDEM